MLKLNGESIGPTNAALHRKEPIRLKAQCRLRKTGKKILMILRFNALHTETVLFARKEKRPPWGKGAAKSAVVTGSGGGEVDHDKKEKRKRLGKRQCREV